MSGGRTVEGVQGDKSPCRSLARHSRASSAAPGEIHAFSLSVFQLFGRLYGPFRSPNPRHCRQTAADDILSDRSSAAHAAETLRKKPPTFGVCLIHGSDAAPARGRGPSRRRRRHFTRRKAHFTPLGHFTRHKVHFTLPCAIPEVRRCGLKKQDPPGISAGGAPGATSWSRRCRCLRRRSCT